MVDFHLHTPYCGHAEGAITQYIDTAIAVGLSEICFTEHVYRYYLPLSQRKRYWDWGIDEARLMRYCAELKEMQELYRGQITIRIGLEADYIDGADEQLAPIISAFPYDFILGSIHCIPRISWHHLSNNTVGNPSLIYREYFKLACAAAESGLFQSIAHIDFIWRYIPWPVSATFEIFADIARFVQCAKQHEASIEINSNGYIWSQEHPAIGSDPFEVLIENIRSAGATITIGSDAHKPDFVAKAFDDIRTMLTSKGITTVTAYTQKKPTAIPL